MLVLEQPESTCQGEVFLKLAHVLDEVVHEFVLSRDQRRVLLWVGDIPLQCRKRLIIVTNVQ